ncbi:MAG TPA: DUF2934 domain-containing protein, partial [Nitrospiria bacterium]|nr:DUF2934 domain-containing protein [Nitrospiria bacterium]
MQTGMKKQQSTTPSSLNGDELQRRIAMKAYERYLDRGQLDGYDVEDWLGAEQLVLAELGDEAGEKD